MNENEFIERNDASSLLQLQQSLNSYVEAIHQLIQMVENNHSLADESNPHVRKSLSTTIATLIEIQKIFYKKIELLATEFNVGQLNSPFTETLLNDKISTVKVKNEVKHMVAYHLKKEYQYRTIVSFEGTQPAPPWKSKDLNNY